MHHVDISKLSTLIRRFLTGSLTVGLVLSLTTGCWKKHDGFVNSRGFTALGQIMGEKTVALCGSNGNIVLLVNKNDETTATPYGQALAAFRQALGKSVHVIATENVELPAAIAPGVEPFSADQFSAVLQKYATANYIISFVGVPRLTPEQIAKLPSPRPQVIVVVAHSQLTPAMLSQKVVCLAAVHKHISDETLADIYSGRISSAQELFDVQYEAVK